MQVFDTEGRIQSRYKEIHFYRVFGTSAHVRRVPAYFVASDRS